MITIIDYGMGNLHSVFKAFKRVGIKTVVSSRKEDVIASEKLILPGVGHFKKGIENLNKLGLVEVLNKRVVKEKIPLLGICLGMQLLTKFSEEGNAHGLGWIDAETIKFRLEREFKIPHMGWNNINIKKGDSIFSGVKKNASFYFVHSFHVECKNEKEILAITNYGKGFVSMIRKENILGIRFHPEKSHSQGLQILKNFVEKA